MNSPLNVAVGVILNSQQHILIAQRPAGKHLSGLWEFPGGKVEAGETGEQALVRELQEEVGVTPLRLEPLISVDYEYEDRRVALSVFLIDQFSGQASGLESQAIKWVSFAELGEYSFPEANQAIIVALRKWLS